MFDVNLDKKTINFIDIDDTMFKTDTCIRVLNKSGDLIDRVRSKDFANYELSDGEIWDFTEYIDSHTFNSTAKPIINVVSAVVNLVNDILIYNSKDRIIFLTAREDMNDKEKFLDTFRNQGIPMDNKNLVYIERAGNLYTYPHKAKCILIRNYLNNNNYSRVRIVDDCDVNIMEFLKLQKEYPEVEFIIFKVTKVGEIEKVS